MQGSWKRTVKPAGEVADLTLVVGWLTSRVIRWPTETLQWLVSDGPEPSWLLLPTEEAVRAGRAAGASGDFFEAIDEFDVAAIRSWRDEIRQRAGGHQTDDAWIESAPMGAISVALQVHSTEVAGRWSGFTIADFATGAESTQDRWIRFEPQDPPPVRAWLVVTNGGAVVRLAENSTGQLLVDTANRTIDDQGTVTRGDFVVDADPDRINVAVQDCTVSGAIIRRLRLSLTPKSRSRVRIAASGSVQVGRFGLGWLSPFWPVVRLFVSPRMARVAVGNIDRVMSSELWLAATRAAKAESGSASRR